MDLQPIYLVTPPQHIAYVKFIFESYEEVGIIRTAERKRAVVVLLAVKDFIAVARKILEALKQEVPLEEISRPADLSDDWLMSELAKDVT
jgi:hypothetical protein